MSWAPTTLDQCRGPAPSPAATPLDDPSPPLGGDAQGGPLRSPRPWLPAGKQAVCPCVLPPIFMAVSRYSSKAFAPCLRLSCLPPVEPKQFSGRGEVPCLRTAATRTPSSAWVAPQCTPSAKQPSTPPPLPSLASYLPTTTTSPLPPSCFMHHDRRTLRCRPGMRRQVVLARDQNGGLQSDCWGGGVWLGPS